MIVDTVDHNICSLTDGAGAQPEGSIAPVTLCSQNSRCPILLLASDFPAILNGGDFNAKAFQNAQCHVNITLGLQRGGQDNAAVLWQKRKGKHQPGDILRADISRKGEVSTDKLSTD